MQAFLAFLDDLINSGAVERRQLQPARLPFFLSGWWHLQSTEKWPIYYISARRVLQGRQIYRPLTSPIEDYFAFRDLYVAIAASLGISSWSFEHLCTWLDGIRPDSSDKKDEETGPAPLSPLTPSLIPRRPLGMARSTRRFRVCLRKWASTSAVAFGWPRTTTLSNGKGRLSAREASQACRTSGWVKSPSALSL